MRPRRCGLSGPGLCRLKLGARRPGYAAVAVLEGPVALSLVSIKAGGEAEMEGRATNVPCFRPIE